MDTLTHALSGALLARACTGPAEAARVRRRVTAGFLAAAFPDLDFVLSFVSPYAYVTGHRGLTHSLLLLPLWALLVGWLFSRLARDREHVRGYAFIAGLAIGIHILGDVITSFGTIVLAPLSDWRVAWSTTFIIDLWFTGILVAGLLASWRWPASRTPAVAALAVLAAYVGAQAWLRAQAIEVGRQHAAARGIVATRIDALPRPPTALNWMVIVEDAGHYHYATINLRRATVPRADADDGLIGRMDAHYLPVAAANWKRIARHGDAATEPLAREVLARPELAFFRWFAEYPLLDHVGRGPAGECVWFRDLRFLTPGRDAWPFRYGLCRADGTQSWRAYEFDRAAPVPVR